MPFIYFLHCLEILRRCTFNILGIVTSSYLIKSAYLNLGGTKLMASFVINSQASSDAITFLILHILMTLLYKMNQNHTHTYKHTQTHR